MAKNYSIRSSPYFRTGVTPDGQQAVLGVLLPNLVVCCFDAEGVFQERRTIPLASPPPLNDGSYDFSGKYRAAATRQMKALERELRLTPQPVSVRAFYDAEAHLGIADLPGDYEEYLNEPDAEEEDAELFEEEIAQWREQGQFVLYWGCEYWMSRDGHVVHTD